MSDDSRKTFTVTDRRHFTPEGEVRDADAPAPVAPPAPPPPVPDPPTAAAAPPAAGEPEAEVPEDLEFPDVPTSLAGLIASLAAQAAYVLAAPVEGSQARSALQSVQSVITLLEVLKDKTEGRRTRDEEDILDSALYELRMGYVARTRMAGA